MSESYKLENENLQKQEALNAAELIDHNKENQENQKIIKNNKLSSCMCCIPVLPCLIFFVILSLAQFIFAIVYHHIIGALLGAIVFILGIVLIYLHFKTKIDLENEKIFNIYIISRYVFFTLSAFVVIFFIIRCFNSAGIFSQESFPKECTSMGACSRVAYENPHENGNLVPIELQTGVKDIEKFIENFIDDYGQAWIVEQKDCYIYSNFVTTFWGFVDDFGVQYCCNTNLSEQKVSVQIQSESRKAGSDFGVNKNRVDEFIKELQKQKFPVKQTCEQ